MEPTNNPISTPNPTPAAGAGVPPVEPAIPTTPAEPVVPPRPMEHVIQPLTPAQPVVSPTPPASSAAPVAPAAPAAPVSPVAPTPITVMPGQASSMPINPLFNSNGGGLVGATDPITMPAPPKAPDPVEEELKAPFKAAGPVPGSIGSAISMPADAVSMGDPGRTPSVSFTDPAMVNNVATSTVVPEKKKTSKSTLILLAIVAGLIVLALAGYLIMTLTQSN